MAGKRTRPAHIDKAMKELRSFARSEMAKTEIIQFRVDQADFERLVEAATAYQMPMGAMVRDWVLDRLEPRKKQTPKSRSTASMVVAEQSSTLWPDASASRRSPNQSQLAADVAELKQELASLKQRLGTVEPKPKRDAKRRQQLKRLTQLSQEAGLYDD